MNEDDLLERFGLAAQEKDLPVVRRILLAEVEREGGSQGEGDTDLMKLCCVQLFSAGQLKDVLTIWRAKVSSMDAGASIDIQLLCGAGLDETKEYLSGVGTEESRSALSRLLICESEGDFEDFSVSESLGSFLAYYDLESG